MKKTLALALVFLLLVSTFSLLLPKVRGLEQFGKTDQGANRWYFWNWFAKVVGRFQAPEDGEIANITFYGLPVGSGMQFRAVVYSDNTGVPDALLAYGNQVPLSITEGWQSAPISLNITGDTYYWIGIQYTGNGRVDFWYDPGAVSQTAWNIDAFDPDDSFGTPNYENYELSIYTSYKPSEPRTWTVDDDRVEFPSADFTSIQEAINASRAGDTIYVYPGTYYDHLLLNKTLSIIGENPKTTIIDGNGTGVNIDISSGVVRIDGFTIQNGSTGIHIFGPGIRANITNSHLRWNDYGLLADDFSDLVIRSSNATYNEYGVSINNAVLLGNVSLTGNNLANNTYNMRINGSVPLAFNSIDIDTSNTINGKPIYYMKNQRDLIIDSSTYPDVGYLGLVSSTNITVRDLTFAENYEGILLAYTNDSTIQNVTSSNNMLGIALYGSDNNTLYHNAFINNTNQVYLYNSFNNTWDNGYPSGGNYWSNHNGTDADHDGIGDTPYIIDADNTDYYPLMYPTFFWPRPPTYSDVGTNTTVAGQPALFHAKWSDDQEAHRWNKDGFALSGFIFSTNNTGSWRNSTWTPLSGSVAWSNITEVLNSTAGVTVQYRFYCNDTYNGWGSTPILTIGVLGVDVNPKSASLQVGQSQTFSATALGGTPPYTIEWIDNVTKQVIGTGTNYTFYAAAEGSYQIYAQATDSLGNTASSVVIQITVNAPPPLTTSISPSSPQFVQVGGTIAFALTVDGGVPLYTQQWYVNSTPVAGETGTAFNFSSAVEGTFIVFTRVTDDVGATVDSTVTTVTVAAPPQKFKSEIRALFVHSMSLYSPDWEVIAETARSYGINTLIVEILTSTGARYPSEYVPVWTQDELTPAIAAAHARGISLYISYDVLLGALTDEYKVQDHNGALLNWTDPTKAISRTLIRNLIEEVSSYDIDGIMLDYIRYASNDMCYGPECRAAFERYLGETITNWPGDFAPGGARYNEFMEWRPHPINYLVRDIRNWALAVNPDLEISAAVWGWEPIDPTYNRYWMGQDSAFWVKEGWLDWVAPMIYTTDINRIDEKMKSYQQYMVAGPEGKIPLVPFLTNAWPDVVDPNNFTQQIDTVRANGADGWIIWRYGGPGDGQGSEALDIRTYLDLIDLYPTFSLRNINISVVGDRHVVTWTTELLTTSMVEYGLSPLFTATLEVLPLTGRNYWEPAHVLGTIIQNSTLRTEHSFEILIPGGTPFYLRIQSRDGQGNATSLVYGIATTGQGILTVDTTPVAGDIYIDGQLMGSGNWSGSVYVGTHIVSYGVVVGYVAPQAQVVDVFENQTTMVIGIYVRLYSAISMWVSSSPALVGYEVNIVGSLIYQHNSSGIANVPVQLYRSIMGAGDSIIASTTTNSNGSFSVTWFSLASGDYIIKAVYTGDSDVDGTETAVNLIIRDIEERVFSVSSNSTVSSLTFNSTSRVISFSVSGSAGTMGYVNIFLSNDLVSDIDGLKVYFDGLEKSYEAVSLDDVWFIHLSYNHSIHTIRIALPTVLPAYTLQPFTTQIMAVMVIALAVALTGAFFIRKKKFRE